MLLKFSFIFFIALFIGTAYAGLFDGFSDLFGISKGSENTTTTASTVTTIQQNYIFNLFTQELTTPIPSRIINFPVCAKNESENGYFCQEHVSIFECNNGEKVNKSLRCNRKKDCHDGSDEFDCEFWPPKITLLPEHKKELLCQLDDTDNFETLLLECEFVGFPEPLIKWKKYEGHVPSKCQQVSLEGRGILLCPNFKQADQGAYSCVAENSVGVSESQPKSLVICKNYIPCNGFKVKSEDNIEHCLDCFCSGKTTNCQNIKSKPTVVTIPFPSAVTDIQVKNNGKIVDTDGTNLKNDKGKKIKYYTLTKEELNENSFLKSYGRSMRIPRYSKQVNYMPDAPDIIIEGNKTSLYYTFNIISPSSNTVDVRFWPGNWHHLNRTTATRRDLMSVLSGINRILFRCEYNKGIYEKWEKNTNIYLVSSFIEESNASVSYVEKCNCPEGYMGLSCESCAQGYEMKIENDDFTCRKIQCDSKNGFFLSGSRCVKSPCSINGSLSLFPDFNGKCNCKENYTGDFCNNTISCKPGYYNVDKFKTCVKCWCSGVTDKCNGSSLYRTEISSFSLGGYNSSNGRNFWLLPSIFSGNRLGSYGGHIKYSLKYSHEIPKQNSLLTVEILTVNETTLSFTHSDIDRSTSEKEKTWFVPLLEGHWKKADKTSANRSEFLLTLTKIKAIYVESPYHISSGKVNLTWVRMSDAQSLGTGAELASQVEQCFCPIGYSGLSCESCAQGYYKKKNTNLCLKCECDNCDPVEGCLSCPKGFYRENSKKEKKPICKPCKCNNREEKCGKDDYNSTYCICKPGFTGLQCENEVVSSKNSSHLTIKISPSKLTSNVGGGSLSFNCTYDSGEKMKLSYKKIFLDRTEGPFLGTLLSSNQSTQEYNGFINFNVELSEDLVQVECLVHNVKGMEVGKVIAIVENTATFQPVKITNCYSTVTHVKETKSKDFICQTTGYPQAKTTWFVKKENGVRQKVESTGGVHSIEAVTLQDNGTIYTCEAENSIGDKDVCSILLIVEKNCDLVHIIPKWQEVEEGDDIILQCRTTANSSVSWSRPNKILPLLRTSEKNGNLNVTNSRIDDSGNYTCKALSSDGKYIEQSAWVNVKEKLIPPVISIDKNDTIVLEESDFEVKCSATGKPVPSVTWMKISGKIDNNVKINNGILKIKGATHGNSGLYQCQANTTAGEDLGRIFIEVKETKVPPKLKIVPSSLIPIEGERAFLECIVLQGKPKPTLYWLKEVNGEFKKFKDGEKLEFLNISRYDGGIYQCKGQNAVGRDEAFSEINVMFIPEITLSQTHIEVYENEEISVKCSAVGNPLPKLMWKNQLKSYKRNIKDNDVLANMYLNPPEITVKLKAFSDLTGLICVAKNEAGESEKEVSVTVLRELVAEERDAQLVSLGSYHELLCNGCEGKLKWEKLNGKLSGDECEIPSGLMIPSVQIQHNASYVCKCDSNPRFKKVFSLIVDGFVPKFTQELKSFLVLPTTLMSKKKVVFEISFKTKKNDGLLFKDENDIFVLYIHDKKVSVLLHMDYEKRHHFDSTINLEHNVWYTIMVEIAPGIVKLIIYDSNSAILEEKIEYFKNLSNVVYPSAFNNFYVGGTSFSSKKSHLHHLHHLHLKKIPSLDGCISRLVIDNKVFSLVKEGSYSTNVNLCRECFERLNPCRNMGKCLDAPTQFGFVCLCPEVQRGEKDSCPPSCYGRGCNNQRDLCDILSPCKRKDLNFCSNKISSLSCSCSLGYSGLTCEKEEQSSFCVGGDGYVKLPSKYLYRLSLAEPETIEIHFSLSKSNGLLLWRGNVHNYLHIGVIDGKVKYTYKNQGIKLQVQTSERLSFDKNHTLIAKRTNESVVLYVDTKTYSNYTKFTTNRVIGDIYLGGAPTNIVPYEERLWNYGLTGCINFVSFGKQQKINFKENVLESLNTYRYKAELATNVIEIYNYDKSESNSEDDHLNDLEYD